MELSQAEPFRGFDNHDAGLGNINSDFDYRSGNQDVRLPSSEFFNNLVFDMTFKFTMQEVEFEIWEYLLQAVKFLFGGFDRYQRFRWFDERADYKSSRFSF